MNLHRCAPGVEPLTSEGSPQCGKIECRGSGNIATPPLRLSLFGPLLRPRDPPQFRHGGPLPALQPLVGPR